ncbi:MAG: tryptophan-rich sensory protein [Methanolobus sp.]|nr:tryptophan-rich sensory protein [Methanolobus sp.]
MGKEQNCTIIKIITLLTFLTMVIVNILANSLPINGVTAGQVSDFYPNLFAPAGLTFAIWGLIYLLLAGYTLYQLGLFREGNESYSSGLLCRISVVFSVSSIANASWIFAWHYQIIPLSLLLIVVMLICLIKINEMTSKGSLTGRDYLFVRLPFSIYFGWITVATIANVTILLVSIGWTGFGLDETIWTVLVLAVGLIIALATMLKNRDVAYGLVIVWAYAGILLKHVSADGWAFQYPVVIYTVLICIAILVYAEAKLLSKKARL